MSRPEVTHTARYLAAAALVATALTTSPTLAQDRTTSGRARMELSLDHGVAFSVASLRSPSGDPVDASGVALAGDLRLYAPSGLGAVARVSYEGVMYAGFFSLDIGAAYRGDLVGGTIGGLQLVASAGASAAYGTFGGSGGSYQGLSFPSFSSSAPVAMGGLWGSIHVDFWHRNSFVGLGLVARAQWADGYGDTLVSLVPSLRVGGDWGL